MPQKKDISPPDLDKYLEGRKHRYVSYKEGAIMYSLPYWTFVNFAKAANATWALRKTAMVDLDKLDKYLDEHCVVESEREDNNMANGRKPIENLDEMVKNKKKKYVRYADVQNSILWDFIVFRVWQKMQVQSEK